MSWTPATIAALAVLGLMIAWGIHYTAWQCGRLEGLAEADRRNRSYGQRRIDSLSAGIHGATLSIDPNAVILARTLGISVCLAIEIIEYAARHNLKLSPAADLFNDWAGNIKAYAEDAAS